MALIEDALKGNLATGLAIGIGAAILAPNIIKSIGSLLRPGAKTLIKGSMVFYHQTLGEIGEMVTDLVAEARAELDEESRSDQLSAASPARAEEQPG